MNEQIWQTFKAVSERRSISEAARFLNLSQSTVSQHVRQLEQEYGTTLFARTGHGMTLTETGEIAYRHINHLLAILAESHRQIAEYLKQTPASLVIGASLTIAEYLLPHVLTRIRSSSQQRDIAVYMANSQEVVDRVVARSLDLGLIESPVTNPHVTVRPFLADHLCLVLGASHPLADRDSVSLDEFTALPLLVREPGSGTRLVLEEALRRVGISFSQLNIQMVLATTQAIKAMIAQGMGVSVLSPLTILPYERELFAQLSIRELPLPRSFSVVHPPDLSHPAAKTLIRTLLTLPWEDVFDIRGGT